jgi:hypothetical protein
MWQQKHQNVILSKGPKIIIKMKENGSKTNDRKRRRRNIILNIGGHVHGNRTLKS